MALKFWDLFRAKSGEQHSVEVNCVELAYAAREYQIRQLCMSVCVNMIANALGRCEFQTFRGHKIAYGPEYWLWNYEPNANQNSTVFLHKLADSLCRNNEALIIESRKRGGEAALVVADSWEPPAMYPSKQNEYRGVSVGSVNYDKTFYERDVLHVRLNHFDTGPVVAALNDSYERLARAALRAYTFDNGQHWKVHVGQIAQGTKDFEANFAKMIDQQLKPFFESERSVLPEFDGYTYTNVGGSSARDSRDMRNLIEDIFEFTARAYQIPFVLISGKVESTADAKERFLTNCLDPICDQLGEEIVRKRYGFEEWSKGNYLRVDSSSINHFDLFANAANVEKLVGSGAFTIEDIRRAAGQPAINEPWANRHYMTLNIAPVENSTRAIEE